MRRVVSLPDRGRLIVATDMQGNASDFERVIAIFEDAVADSEGATLVVTGDLVHGPELSQREWPDYLGSYYLGNSKDVIQAAREVANRYPGRVHFLLGNHEHSHVGGPVVSKFFPDEARRLEDILGPEATREMRAWMYTWPFVAVAKQARLLMLHAAPHAKIESTDDLDRLPLDGFFDVEMEPGRSTPPVDTALQSTLGALLWARTTSTERARAFLDAVEPDCNVAIYGHDVARAGHVVEREPLLCISTSFGCFDGDKMYLEWDLSLPASCARDVARIGLRPLHPNAAPVHRGR